MTTTCSLFWLDDFMRRPCGGPCLCTTESAGSDVPLAVTPAAPKPGVPAFVAAEQLVQKVPQALRGFFNGFVGLIMRKREVFR
jgi:hypothetical protein